MGNQALSQDEIDALFKGGRAEADTPPVALPETDVQLYDFRRPNRVSKDRQRTLEGMYGSLSKSLEGWLAGRVRTQVEVSLSAAEQLSFGEFVLSLPEPCASFVFHVGQPGGPQAVIDLGREFAFYAVERFLGGAAETFVPDRPLTVLERRVVRIVAERTAALVQDIWKEHSRMDLRLARFESVPDMLQAANREDPMLVTNLRVRFRGQNSSILICLPFSILESFFATSASRRVRSSDQSDEERSADRFGVEHGLRRASTPVAVRLPRFELSLGELLALRPGGTLTTGIRRDAPVEVLINGHHRFDGAIGTLRNALAVQLTRPIESEGEEPHHV
jgi:flagellar motor switch protein FliM